MNPPMEVQAVGSPRMFRPIRPEWAVLSQKSACERRRGSESGREGGREGGLG